MLIHVLIFTIKFTTTDGRRDGDSGHHPAEGDPRQGGAEHHVRGQGEQEGADRGDQDDARPAEDGADGEEGGEAGGGRPAEAEEAVPEQSLFSIDTLWDLF